MPWYWIIILATTYGVALGVVADKCNRLGGFWLFLTWLIGATVPWAWISRYSKNLVFDGLLYDMTLCFAFYGTLCLVVSRVINMWQYVGICLCIIGLFIFKFFET